MSISCFYLSLPIILFSTLVHSLFEFRPLHMYFSEKKKKKKKREW